LLEWKGLDALKFGLDTDEVIFHRCQLYRRQARAILRLVATAAEVDRVLRTLVRRFDKANDSSKPSLDSDRTIVCEIPDLNLVYRGAYKDGRIERFAKVRNGTRGDVRIEVDSDDLVALAEGRMSLTRALFTGRLSIDAAARDLMVLRQLL
jgi:predicted lipid carrier protein YhbT